MKVMFGFMLFITSSVCVVAQSRDDSMEFWSAYDQEFYRKFDSVTLGLNGRELIKILQGYMDRGTLTPHEKYLIQRELINQYRFVGEREAAKAACEQSQIRDDDFETKAACIQSVNLPLEKQRIALETILRKAIIEKKGTIIPVSVAEKMLDVLWKQNDVATAQSVYKSVLAVTPRQAVGSLIALKESAALIYANPSNSPKVLREALHLYDELEDLYRSNPGSATDADRVVYNRGILKLMSFEDYTSAIQDFSKLSAGSRNWIDSRVFLAFSWLNVGQKEKSLSTLQGINLGSYPDSMRRSFLICYQQIILFELRKGPEPSACVKFPPDTQSEVIFHITRYLHQKKLSSSLENELWRQFWVLYKDRLAPQMQSQIEQYVSAIELQQARLDSEVKSLELRNFQMVKGLFAASLLAIIVIAGLLVRLRSRKKRIEKLQTYIHKSVLSRFLPPILVDEIIQGKSRIESEPHEQAVTVLFADMVEFTQISGQLGAQSSAKILNQFMHTVSEVIYENAGTIDKFIGDAVMVIFGAPLQLQPEEQARRALVCAKAMLQAIDELNRTFTSLYDVSLSMRVGINHGLAIVGTFGGLKRSDYTAIGPTVNLASRIEGKARPGQILLGPDLAKLLPPEWLDEPVPSQLKGIEHTVPLYPARIDVIAV